MSNINAARIVSISRKTIKPSSPTPSSLRHHNLSYIDHLSSNDNIPVVYLYSRNTNNSNLSDDEITRLLENSLSKTLESYYPFAGTISNDDMNGCFIECNDAGAEFLDVRVSCSMSEILKHNPTSLVFPKGVPWNDTTSNGSTTLVTVQVTHFDSCDGIAISVCVSHKIADGHSVCRFVNDWAAIARGESISLSPTFDTCSFFPPATNAPPALANLLHAEPKLGKPLVTKAYHFSSASLSKLKATVAKESTVQDPTDVEVLTAILHKTAVAATTTISGGSFKPSFLCHEVGWRPPVHLNTIGNAFFFFVESSPAIEEKEMQVPKLVEHLRKAKEARSDKLTVAATTVISETLDKLIAGATQSQSNGLAFHMYLSDSCKMDFNATDFGLGKPARVFAAPPPIKDYFIFGNDPSRDGIDVMITLEEPEMSIFQSDKELLQFASLINDLSLE